MFWDEYIGVQTYWCDGDGRREAAGTEEALSGSCHSVRRGSQRPPGSTREPVTNPAWGAQGSRIQRLSPDHPPHPGSVPRLGGPRPITPSANPPAPFPSPGRALLPPPPATRARRPRPSTPGAWGPVPALPGPEHGPERSRAQPPAQRLPEPPGRPSPARRSPSAIFPQPGPAAPHLPPPRTPKPPAAIFEQGRPSGPGVAGAVTGQSGPCRPPSCSRRHVCAGRGPPCPNGGRKGARGEERRRGGASGRIVLTISYLREKAAEREVAARLRHRSRRALRSKHRSALLKDGSAGFAPLEDGGGAAPPQGGGAAAAAGEAGVSLRRARGSGTGTMLALVARAAVRATPGEAAPPGGPCAGQGTGRAASPAP